MLIASPAAVATAKLSRPPKSAAASAGTTSRLVSVGSRRPDTPATRITARPAKTVATTQLRNPRRSGESPVSMAPVSCSEAARVASPKRVYR